MIFVTSAYARPDVRNLRLRPEPLVSLPREQQTTGSGDENDNTPYLEVNCDWSLTAVTEIFLGCGLFRRRRFVSAGEIN